MKQVPAALQSHLDSGATTLCWAWRIERADGQVFGFTDHDLPLSFDGTDYEPESGFAAAELRHHASLAVDSQEASGALSSDRITETDIIDGLWDNAEIQVWRVNWADTSQRVLMRRANIGQIRRGKAAFVAEVRSLAHILNQTVGRTFQYYCDAELGDGRCKVNLDAAAFKGTGAVASIVSDRIFTASGLGGFASGWFEYGYLTWTTGANAGRRAEIASHTILDGGAVEIALLEEPVRAITVADGFEISAGCDKQFSTCNAKFANQKNFRGFPSIPGDDLVVRYVTPGDKNDGETL